MLGCQNERGKEGGFHNPVFITCKYFSCYPNIMFFHDCFPERCMICYVRRLILERKGVAHVIFSNQLYCQYSNPAPIFTNKPVFNMGFLSEKEHPLSFLGLMGAKAAILCLIKK